MSVVIANYTKDNQQSITEYSLENKLSLINFDECLDYLKQINIIQEGETLLYKKTDWSSKLDTNIT